MTDIIQREVVKRYKGSHIVQLDRQKKKKFGRSMSIEVVKFQSIKSLTFGQET